MQNLTRFATALCLASYSAGLQLVTESQLETSDEDFFAKAGMICSGCSNEQFDAIEVMNNWYYPYKITNGGLDPAYANENNIEFVAMLSQSSTQLSDGSWCGFRDPPTDVHSGQVITTPCTVDMIVDTLADTQALFTTPIQYLMGPNEAYVKPKDGKSTKKNQKYIPTDQLVEMWRNVMQPAAVKAGLKLVSTTTGAPNQKVSYLTAFLAGCWQMRNEETNPCDVNLIKAFSVHDYKCAESYWEDNYTVGTGKFYRQAVQQLNELVGEQDEIDWADYVNNMPLWVQETSCSGDPTPPSSAQQICERLTGQAVDQGQDFGTGSVRWLVAADNIERWSWYTSYNTKSNGNPYNRLLNAEGEVLPPGRAILNEGGEDTDCSGEPQT